MRLKIVLEIDVDRFISSPLEEPKDVLQTLKSHYDSVQHMLEESNVQSYSGHIIDDQNAVVEFFQTGEFER